MKGVYPIAVSCHVLQVSSSGYFRWRNSRDGAPRLCSGELALAHIRAIHAEVKGEYGWPRIHKELQARGLRIGKKWVRKLMAEHGIRAKTKRKFVVTRRCCINRCSSSGRLAAQRFMQQRPFNSQGQ